MHGCTNVLGSLVWQMVVSDAQKVTADSNFVGMMLVGMRDTLNLPGRVRGNCLMSDVFGSVLV